MRVMALRERTLGRLVLIVGLAVLGFGPVRPAPAQEQGGPPAVDRITRFIELPGPTAMAHHGPSRHLAVGHVADGRGKVTLFRINQGGEPDQIDSMDLPRPEGLSALPNQPLAVTFHPKLPVLYAWQDVRAQGNQGKKGKQDRKLARQKLDHLVLYRIKDESLKQIGAYCRGPAFAVGQAFGSLTVSGDGKRLFIPNMARPAGVDRPGAIGYFDLDEQGQLVPALVRVEGERNQRGVNKFEKKIRPEWVRTGAHRGGAARIAFMLSQPTGTGFYAHSKRALTFGTRSGVGLWDTEDRRAELSEVLVAGIGSGGDKALPGAHHALPMLYLVRHGTDRAMAMPHARGFPTLLPRRIRAGGGASFRAPPVVVQGAMHAMVVASGGNELRFLELDEEGYLTGRSERLRLEQTNRGPIRAYAYAPEVDRLYVAVSEKP